MKLYTQFEYDQAKLKDLLNFQCDQCQKQYTKTKKSKSDRIYKQVANDYCSANCSHLGHRNGKTLPCLVCGCLIYRNKRTLKKTKGKAFCNQSCAAKHNNQNRDWSAEWSDERRKNLRELVLATKPGFMNPSFIKNYSKIKRKVVPKITFTCGECCKEFSVIPSAVPRKFCSRLCSSKNMYHPNSTKKTIRYYNGQKFDSRSEVSFATLLDKNNIKWIKNSTISFPFTDTNGKVRKYFPDFYLPDLNWWVEIKGRYYIRKHDPQRIAAVGSNIETMFHDEIRLPKPIIEKADCMDAASI